VRVKRGFDVVVSAALLLPLLPFMAVIAVLIRVTDGSPVLHRAVRSGQGGHPFVMYKFRTMTLGSKDTGVTGPDDPRVTRVGRVLRRGRLDELPQLFNVLAGDMSLVGPRPEDPRFVAAYTEEQEEVLTVRPGVTSPTAIRFRDEAALLPSDPSLRDTYYAEVVLPEKLALDLDYVRRRSFVSDLRILAETVAMLTRRADRDPRMSSGAGGDAAK
jgi:lipopolysaccharide/colanic/teichoic acid biosynthesis glycosyltransferase